jgi:DNA (cytosine-5)-methyltransferase 1
MGGGIGEDAYSAIEQDCKSRELGTDTIKASLGGYKKPVGKSACIRVLDLFCGCGGSSLGFKLAAEELGLYPEIIGVDIDRDACITFQKNRVGQAIRADVRRAPFRVQKGLFNVIIGCPPCQGFTRIGRRSNPKDPRNKLVRTFAELVRSLLPEYVLFENVPRVRNSHYYRWLVRRLKESGYELESGVVDAADYGVPQRRKRLILIASRKGRPSLPKPVWRRTTVREAIGDLPPLEAGAAHPTIPNHRCMAHSDRVLARIRLIPRDGGSRSALPARLQLKCHRRARGYNDVYGRMRWDDVAPTLTTGCTNPSKGRFIHPEQNRAITPREAARLQTFPDWFIFYGGFTSISRQIGNAVPVMLMKHVSEALLGGMP